MKNRRHRLTLLALLAVLVLLRPHRVGAIEVLTLETGSIVIPAFSVVGSMDIQGPRLRLTSLVVTLPGWGYQQCTGLAEFGCNPGDTPPGRRLGRHRVPRQLGDPRRRAPYVRGLRDSLYRSTGPRRWGDGDGSGFWLAARGADRVVAHHRTVLSRGGFRRVSDAHALRPSWRGDVHHQPLQERTEHLPGELKTRTSIPIPFPSPPLWSSGAPAPPSWAPPASSSGVSGGDDGSTCRACSMASERGCL
jgi:hypothetical protein